MKGAPLLVIGYGNPLRADDGFGPAVAEALLERGLEGVEVISCHQLMPELAQDISRAGRVVFVDASVDTPAGQMTVQTVLPVPLPRHPAHHLRPGHLLALALALYGNAPDARLVTVGAVSLDHGEELTGAVQQAVSESVHVIQQEVKRPDTP